MRRLTFLISVVVVLTCGMNADAAVKTAILSAELSDTVPEDELRDTGLFDSVDWIDVGLASGSTPTLSELASYDSLLVYSSVPFKNRSALSAVLKDYVDGGGHVVLAAYCFTDDTMSYLDYAIGPVGSTDGILTAGCSPFKPVIHENADPTSGNIYALLPDDPIFNGITIDADGLLSDFGYFHNANFTDPILDTTSGATTGGANLLADDGPGGWEYTNMIARNDDGNVVALNLFPSVRTANTGEFYQLVANALQPVPEPATSIIWVLLGFGLMVAIRTRT